MLNLLKISFVTVVSLISFIGCGDKFDTSAVGSADFELAASLATTDEEAAKFEKASTITRYHPHINAFDRRDENTLRIRLKRGTEVSGLKFQKWNISLNGNFWFTLKCPGSKDYCVFDTPASFMQPGKAYTYTVSGIDSEGGYSTRIHKIYTNPGEDKSSAGEVFFYDGLYFRVVAGVTCRVKKDTVRSKGYAVTNARPNVAKMEYGIKCNY